MTDDERGNELVQVKIRRKTWRLLKMISAWKGVDIVDYVEELVARETPKDVEQMMSDLGFKVDRKKRE